MGADLAPRGHAQRERNTGVQCAVDRLVGGGASTHQVEDLADALGGGPELLVTFASTTTPADGVRSSLACTEVLTWPLVDE